MTVLIIQLCHGDLPDGTLVGNLAPGDGVGGLVGTEDGKSVCRRDQLGFIKSSR